MYCDFAPHQKKSSIKKTSVLKSSHEIAQLKGSKPGRKVHFADLKYVDDVDDYIHNEEMSYSKASKCQPRKSRSPASSQDYLARKDGLDVNSIIGSKRRRAQQSLDKSHDEDGQSLFKTEYRRESSTEAEPEPKRKKLVHGAEVSETVEARSPKKFKSALPPGLRGTMDRAAEEKYNSMINLLFGTSKKY